MKDETERQTTITMDAPSNIRADEYVEIAVRVVNGYGAPVADGRVTLTIDGHMEFTATTDASGLARFQFLSGMKPGLHHIDVSFKGRHGYRDSSTAGQLLVEEVGAVSAGTPLVVTPLARAGAAAAEPPIGAQPAVAAQPAHVQPIGANIDSLSGESAPAALSAKAQLVNGESRSVAPMAAATVAPTPVATAQSIANAQADTAAPATDVRPASDIAFIFTSSDLTLYLLLFALLAIPLGLRIWTHRVGQHKAQADPGSERKVQETASATPANQRPFFILQTSRFWQLVFSHIHTVKWSLVMAAASMVGSAAIDLITPWPLKLIFDYLLLGQEFPARLAMLQEFIGGNNLVLLGVLAGSIGLIALLQSGFAYWENYRTTLVGYELVNTLRRELFLHFQRLSLTYHSENKRGELLYNVARDSQTISDAFTDSALSLVTQVLTMVGMFVVMFWVNWQLSLIPLISFPILLFTYNRLQKRLKKEVRKQRDRESGIAAQLTENLSIMPVIQSFGREKFEAARFDVENRQNLESGVKIARMSAALNRTVMVISEGGLATVIFFGAWMALTGQMTPGDVLIFITYVRTMYKPIRGMVKMTTKLNSAWVASQRIASVLDIEPEVQDRPDAIVAERLRGEIEFDHVHFHYKPERKVLRDVSFAVRPGQRVALVGSSGAGKSTIASLLLRLYDPRRGAIYIDGMDLRDYTRESLRHQIGLVLQDAMLFGATIGENIAYGKPNATPREIETAARQAHIHDFIAALPNGYDTVIGEMGAGLSGGQRQRIAIARALVKQPSILILDEPTSALDAESKALVDETINHLQKGKTIVVIAHQLSSIQTADQILVMRQGEIVERGTHHELMLLDGVYAELYRLQNEQIVLPALRNASGLRSKQAALQPA
ncbi:MAG: ABC transporter transmembrane domain-containing protein [Caldilineaceae bacterium]